MKISEMIVHLQELKYMHGDLPVMGASMEEYPCGNPVDINLIDVGIIMRKEFAVIGFKSILTSELARRCETTG